MREWEMDAVLGASKSTMLMNVLLGSTLNGILPGDSVPRVTQFLVDQWSRWGVWRWRPRSWWPSSCESWRIFRSSRRLPHANPSVAASLVLFFRNAWLRRFTFGSEGTRTVAMRLLYSVDPYALTWKVDSYKNYMFVYYGDSVKVTVGENRWVKTY